MKLPFFHPEAEKEYADAAIYYTEIDPELGGRFYDERDRLIRDIRNNPEQFFCVEFIFLQALFQRGPICRDIR